MLKDFLVPAFLRGEIECTIGSGMSVRICNGRLSLLELTEYLKDTGNFL